MTTPTEQILQGMKDARQLAQWLRDGVNADIWYDAAEHRDDDVLAVIERTQEAMQAAARVFDALAEYVDNLMR